MSTGPIYHNNGQREQEMFQSKCSHADYIRLSLKLPEETFTIV